MLSRNDNMSRQIPLFAQQPQSPDDIDGHTSLEATFDLFAVFLRGEGKSENTVKAFRGDMQLLAEFAGGEMAIGQLRTPQLYAFLDWMEHQRGVPCSRKTYARRVTSLKVYCKWLQRIDGLAHDPARAIRQRSGPSPLSDFLNDRQVRDCLTAAQSMEKGGKQDFRPEFLFRLLLQTGIKKAECGRLRLQDIDRSDTGSARLFVRHKVRDVYKERRIELDVATQDLLVSYQALYDLHDRVFECTTRNLEYILTDIGNRAGVPFKLSFEVMRWTMAVRDYVGGADEERIREKMGLSKASWYETGDKIRRLAAGLGESSATKTDSIDA